MDKQWTLFYRQEAEKWVEALPLGNGRVGAMVFGGAARERIALNEDSLWSGYPKDKEIADAREHFAVARRMTLEGRLHEAEEYIEDHLLGPYSESYLPLGDLFLDFDLPGAPSDYRRSLSLNEALCETAFTAGGVAHRREVFVSHPAQALFMRLSADQPGALSFALSLASPLKSAVAAEGNRLRLTGLCPSVALPSYIDSPEPLIYEEDDARKGIRFAALADVRISGGSLAADAGKIVVQNADEAVIRFAVRTSFNGFDRLPFLDGRDCEGDCARDMEAALAMPYEEARRAHTLDHQRFFERVSIDLMGDRYAEQPTDERLKNFPAQSEDRNLCETLFQYGRYLTIAGSREGTQATNLQGIWNDILRAPWSGNYTVNINTEMNYWPAERANLSELCEPLFDLVDGLVAHGAQTAQTSYGARGAVSHHNTDLWRMSNPVGAKRRGMAGCAYWPMSLGWLCQHLQSHYDFTRDRDFLFKRALPAFRAAARFYLDAMAREDGRRFICPATSPENAFYYKGQVCKVSKAATMSNAIVREVLQNYLAALDTLGMTEDMAAEAREALPEIYPYEIGAKGQLLEWDQDYEEPEPNHRHVSHLYGLYPGYEISPRRTPAWAEACKRSLELRGDEGTGWSLGWKINLWARLLDGDHALKLIKRQLRYVEGDGYNMVNGGGTYANMFDAHPPFQIDGNYGAAAGITELFVQNDGDDVYLLPALPGEWANGSVGGLRAHGGLAVDLAFAEGKLTHATVRRVEPCADAIRVHYGAGKCATVTIAQGEEITLA